NVDPRPLAAHARQRPGLQLVLINAFWSVRPAALGPLAKQDNIAFDIAMLEGVGGVAELLKHVPASRVLFGSYAPFYPFEAAPLKLQESELDAEVLMAITVDNPFRILPLPLGGGDA